MRKLPMILSVTLMTLHSAFSQELKIGYIDNSYIYGNVPEYQSLLKEIEDKSRAYQEILNGKYAEYQRKSAELNSLPQKTTPSPILQDRVSELESLRKSIEDFQNNSEADIRTLYASKLAPITNRVKTAIDRYSRQQNFLFIVRSDLLPENGESRPILLFAASAAEDVSDGVLRLLGVETPRVPKSRVGKLEPGPYSHFRLLMQGG
jgi:outer membrane protein